MICPKTTRWLKIRPKSKKREERKPTGTEKGCSFNFFPLSRDHSSGSKIIVHVKLLIMRYDGDRDVGERSRRGGIPSGRIRHTARCRSRRCPRISTSVASSPTWHRRAPGPTITCAPNDDDDHDDDVRRRGRFFDDCVTCWERIPEFRRAALIGEFAAHRPGSPMNTRRPRFYHERVLAKDGTGKTAIMSTKWGIRTNRLTASIPT